MYRAKQPSAIECHTIQLPQFRDCMTHSAVDANVLHVYKLTLTLNSYDIAHECVVLFNCSVSDAVCRKKVKFFN